MRTSSVLLWALALTCYAVVSAQMGPSPAPMSASAGGPSMSYGPTVAEAPEDPCMTSLFNMSDCLSYVSNGSTTTKPDKACCPELAGLVESNPICLCKLLGNKEDIGISIDVKRALNLPKACGVTTPSVSLCSAIGINVPVPEGAPMPMTGSPMDSSSPEGSPSSPSTTGDDKNNAGYGKGTSLAFAAVGFFLLKFFF
ncbi:hypothetical protein ACFE04_011529 [Oxalis oulophora]